MSTSNRRRTYASSKGKYDYEGVLCVDYTSAIWSSPDGINWTKLGNKPSTIKITDKINADNYVYNLNTISNIVWLHDDVYAFLLNLTYSSTRFPMVVEGTISQLLAGTATRKWGMSNLGKDDRYLSYAHRFYGTNKAIFGVSEDRDDGFAYSEWLDLPSSAVPNYVDMNDTIGTDDNILDRVYFTTAYNSSFIYNGYVFSRINTLDAYNGIYLFRHPIKGGWSSYLNCYTYLTTNLGDYGSECYEVCYCNNRIYAGVREYDDSDGTTVYRVYYTNANPSSDERQNLSTSYTTNIGNWTDGAYASMSATDTEVHIYRDRVHYTLTGTSLTIVNSSMTEYPCNFGVFRIKDTYISSNSGRYVIYSTDLNTWTRISQNFYPRFFTFIGEVGS